LQITTEYDYDYYMDGYFRLPAFAKKCPACSSPALYTAVFDVNYGGMRTLYAIEAGKNLRALSRESKNEPHNRFIGRTNEGHW
jgi:hypothetical protein